MSTRQRASKRITERVTSWPGVTTGPGRRRGFAFKVGGREIGHSARTIETEADVDDVIALLRLNDERVVARHGLPNQTAA